MSGVIGSFCARAQDGERCRNAVNLNRCRFCDFHVQAEYARLKGSRGQLQDATLIGRMSAQAQQAGAATLLTAS